MFNNSATGFGSCARLALAALAATCGLSLGAGAMGQVAPAADPKTVNPAGQGPGLGFFDARLDASGVPLARVTAHVDLIRRGAAAGQRAAEIAALQGQVEGVVVDDDPLMGTARFVRSTGRFLTGPNKGVGGAAPIDVVKGFVGRYPALFEIDAAEIDKARVERDFGTDQNGARHLTYQQQIGGADLYEAEIRANVTRDGELINIQSTMLPRPVGGAGDFVTPAIKFEDNAAIVIASANVGVRLGELPTARGQAAGTSRKRTWETPKGLRSNDPLTTELVYFALDRDTIHPAWNVSVPVPGDGHTYDIIVDAADGAILRRADRLVWDSTQPIMMRVYTRGSIGPGCPGTATPTGFQYPVVARELVTINPADVTAFSPNGWVPDGSVGLVGNNTSTYLDVDASNTPDTPLITGVFDPVMTTTRVYDFAMDTTQAPSTYRSACVAQMFYYVNWYHDRLYAMGFNEAAKNFQTTNFTGAGLGGDAVLAECQDGSGTNNANFMASGSDGTTGRCQMYIFTGPTPDRDGAFDGGIVLHELTHGTSIRLHNGLDNDQSAGMGEGWSDFFALSLMATASDDPGGVYDLGGYTTLSLGSGFTNNYYFGIRRFPYCTDLNKAPQTYADIDPAQLNFAATIPHSPVISSAAANADEVHNTGEVWCEMLNEGRLAMWQRYPPTPTLQPNPPVIPTGRQVLPGNQRMLQNVLDGMKLSVAQPTLIQSRDAIIQANVVDNAGADVILLWRAFAKRGLGFSATSPASTTTSGIVEAYDLPPMASFTFPDGLPTQLQPGVATSFRVNVGGATTYGAPIPGSGQIFVSINGGAFSALTMTQTATNQYTATISAQTCYAGVSYYFGVTCLASDSTTVLQTSPTTAPTAVYKADVYTSSTNVVTDGFETNTGWTVNAAGTDTATTGIWERATPQATAAQAGAAHTGTFCWVTAAAAGASVGANDVDGGATTLTSLTYDLSAYHEAVVSYWRWYSNAAGGSANPNTNTFRVDVSVNGSTWTNAETVGPAGPDTNPGWRQASWKFSSLGLTPTATVRVRFTAEDLTGAVVEAAVDDFKIDGRVCAVSSATGACCVTASGGCLVGTAAACAATSGGSYLGDNSVCTVVNCPPPPPSGACCASNGACTVLTSAACAGVGAYQGNATGCVPNLCVPVTFVVSISKSGSGLGTVASAPGGISCGATCSGSFVIGTNLVLTATAAADSKFSGWSGGGCSGTGDCSQPVNGPLTINARFRCKADFNDDGTVNVTDIFAYLSAWFGQNVSADFNGDSVVNVGDIFAFLSEWFSGC